MQRSTTHRPSRLRFAALGATVALALTACGQSSSTAGDAAPTPTPSVGSSTEPVTISYMNFSSNGGQEKSLAAIVDAFEAANHGITVKVETVPYDDYFTKLQTAVAGGSESDTFELNYENFVTYAGSGALSKLSDVNKAAYPASLLDAFAMDGTQYGLPESFSNVVLFYNKALFDAAGVATPSADWTWADARKAAEKLTNKKTGVWGYYQPVSFFEFYKALAQSGGEFFNKDKTKATFNSPAGVEAATWLTSKPGTIMPTEADGAGTPDYDTNLFKQGKLAMWVNGIWQFSGLSKVQGLDWDIVVEPGNTKKASAMFTNGVVASAKTKHPAEAQRWLEFLTSSDTMVTTRLAASWELPPVSDQSKLASYLDVTPPANRKAVFDSLDATVLPPVIASQQELQDMVGEALSNAAAGRKSVKAALDDAAGRVDDLLK